MLKPILPSISLVMILGLLSKLDKVLPSYIKLFFTMQRVKFKKTVSGNRVYNALKNSKSLLFVLLTEIGFIRV